MKPIRLKPQLIKTTWAGNKLANIRKYKSNNIGIIREVSSYRGLESVVMSGDYVGFKINKVIEENKESFMGDVLENQLIRVAYIDSKDKLSVQVHPNKAIAKLESDYEKTETWYILDCKANAYVYAGSKTADLSLFESSIASGGIERQLVKIKVEKGDIITIPAGLVHACGSDMLVLEIGSYGGITYRIFDYNSPRELQIKSAMRAINLDLKPQISRNMNNSTRIIKNEIYTIEEYIISEGVKSKVINTENAYNILINVEGILSVETKFGFEILNFTDTIIIPASIGRYSLSGNGRILRVMVS